MKYYTFIFVILAALSVEAQNSSPVPVKEGTQFFYKPSIPNEVKSVSVAGSMNNWDKTKDKMAFDTTDNTWKGILKLTEGVEYSYKFVVNDSLWITDANAPAVTEDEWKNGLITPQKFGIPFVEKIFPASNIRLNYIPHLKLILHAADSTIDSASIKFSFDDSVHSFQFNVPGNELTADLDSMLKDGEHKIELKFADKKGNINNSFISKFFIDRFVTEIKTPSFYDTAVMYEVYIRKFADWDNDGTGDFRGLASNLDYLKDYLGVNTLWLMPFTESSKDHGYNVVDYYKVEKDYGNFDDYQYLLKNAKTRGMKVLMDFVINHTDSAHHFFVDAYKNNKSKYSNWYQFTDSTNSDWKHFGVERNMPKLNFENKEVQDYFIKVAKYWVDPNGDGNFSDGVDGFRCDAAKEIPHQFWSRLRTELKKINPNILLLGEVWDSANFMVPFYKDEFDMLFNYPLLYAMDKYFSSNDIISLKSKITELRNIFPAGYQSVNFLANHDNNRALSRYNDTLKLKQALFIIMTLPGTPMLYYGDEAGLKGKLPAENVRQKIDWKDIEREKVLSNSFVNFYKDIIELREKHPALSERDDKKHESLAFLNDEENKLLVYVRYNKEKKYMAVINNSGSAVDSVKLRKDNKIPEFETIKEIYSSQKTKNKITFNINSDYIFLDKLNMLNGSFKLFELK